MKTIAEQSEEGTEKALTKFQQWMKDTFGDGKLTAQQSAEIKTLTDKIAGLEAAAAIHAQAIVDLNTAHATEISTLKATHATELQAAKNGATAALAKVNIVPLPETGTGTGQDAVAADTYETTLKAIEKETDATKRHALVQKARELRWK